MKKNLIKILTVAAVAAFISVSPAMAGQWRTGAGANASRWWYVNDDGSYAANGWHQINNVWYYFDNSGWLLANTVTPDGYIVDRNGAWVQTAASAKNKQNTVTLCTSYYRSAAKAASDDDFNDDSNDDSDDDADNASNKHSASDEIDLSSYAEECFELINKERTARGLDALEWDDSIAEACDIRAEELTEKYSHVRPDGTTCFTAFDEVGAEFNRKGENIAAGQTSPKAAVNAWMHSKGHRENILNDSFTSAAIGFYYGPDARSGYKYHWVQMFAGSPTHSSYRLIEDDTSDDAEEDWDNEQSNDAEEENTFSNRKSLHK